MFVSLQDNQYKGSGWDKAVKLENNLPSERPKELEVLKQYSGKTLTDLANSKNKDKYGKFLIFPFDAAKSDLNDDKKVLFELLDAETDNPKFRTGNVMGFFSLRGEKRENGEVPEIRMQITSRFDDAEGKNNFFLHYMLQKVCNIAIAPHTSSGNESLYDFLPYLFPNYLNEACKQGIYRAYVTREYNDANVRGPIDVARHIRYNIPFNGKVAYHTREYTADNKITQLVRHTYEYIRSIGISIFDGDVRDDVNKIIQATPSYSRNARSKVIAQNQHPVTHPYYTAYEPLRVLCLGILQHKKISYGENSENNIAGILFDGASLWEEYLNVLLKENCDGRLVHPNNRTGDNKQHLFNKDESDKNRTIYPDFLWGLSDDKYRARAVLDAKYKPLDDKGLCRDDAFQMLAYMFRFDSKNGYLLYPQKNNDTNKNYSKNYALFRDASITIQSIGFEIPSLPSLDKDKFEIFIKKMKSAEEAFINRIKKLLGEPVEESKMFD